MSDLRILVVAPHQDDETIGCGGTIRKLVNYGHQVDVLHVFEGSTNYPGHDAVETIQSRKEEAEACAQIIGFNLLENLGLEDRSFPAKERLVTLLTQAFRAISPHVVFVPHSGEADKEHQLINYACTEALWLSKIPGFKGAKKHNKVNTALLFYEVWTPIPAPNLIVDISEEAEVKGQAIETFKSQLIGNDWLAGSLGLNAYRAATHAGKGHAEAFAFHKLTEDQLSLLGQIFHL